MTAILAADVSAKAREALQQVFYIWYPVQFQGTGQISRTKDLINSGSEVNTMTPAFTAKLGLMPKPINVGI